MWSWHDGMDGWGGLWMALTMAIVWLPLILLVAWALIGDGMRHRDRSPGAPLPPGTPAEPDAREVARRAYARGEIDRERYLQVIEDLDRTARPAAAPPPATEDR